MLHQTGEQCDGAQRTRGDNQPCFAKLGPMGSCSRKDCACVQPVFPTQKLVWAYPERISGQAVSLCRCCALYKTVPSSHNFSVLALAWFGLSPFSVCVFFFGGGGGVVSAHDE